MFHYRGDRDLGVAFQAPPGSQASSRGEVEDSALLSSRTGMSWSPLSGIKARASWGDLAEAGVD